LVQVLIVMDFLLSLSAKAKDKLAKALPESLNKSVMYADQTLSEDDVSCSTGRDCDEQSCFASGSQFLAYPLPLPLDYADSS
jgi:hypothetical protein